MIKQQPKINLVADHWLKRILCALFKAVYKHSLDAIFVCNN